MMILESEYFAVLLFTVDDELDGEPLDLDGDVLKSVTDVKSAQLATAPVGFAASRWETIDPEQVKAQGNGFMKRLKNLS